MSSSTVSALPCTSSTQENHDAALGDGMPPQAPMSVCVYCGSRDGTDPRHGELAEALGRAIAGRGWQMVYGGGRVGLMGRVADAALAAGGRVVGVIPTSLMRREVGHVQLSELHVVETMHDRKRLMAERSDAFVALPGGIGTFEELFEAWTWRHLGYHARPVALLDLPDRSHWTPLMAFLEHSTRAGFVDAAQRAMLQWHDDVESLLDALASAQRSANERLRLI